MKFLLRLLACVAFLAVCLILFFPYAAFVRYTLAKAGARAVVVSAGLTGIELRDVSVPLKRRARSPAGSVEAPALTLDMLKITPHPLLIGFSARGEIGGGSFDLRSRGWRRPSLTLTAKDLPLGKMLNDDRLDVRLQAEGSGAIDPATLTFLPEGVMKGRLSGAVSRFELRGFPVARVDIEQLSFESKVLADRIDVSSIELKTNLASFRGSVTLTPPQWPFQSMTASGDITSSLITGGTKTITDQPVF